MVKEAEEFAAEDVSTFVLVSGLSHTDHSHRRPTGSVSRLSMAFHRLSTV